MTYATQQLTYALQELTHRSQQAESAPAPVLPQTLNLDQSLFSQEIQEFLDKKQAYAARTRGVSVGVY